MSAIKSDKLPLETDELHLEEPHFDEEATVLSARPVIPFDELPSAKGISGLTLAAVVGIALLVGALGSVLVYRFLGTEKASVAEENGEPVKPVAVDGSVSDLVEPADVPAPQTEVASAPQTEVASAPHTEVASAPAPAPTKVKAAIPSPPKLEKQTDQETERELRRAEKREARRQHQIEKEARRQQPDDRPRRVRNDPLKIEEIFEGVRRP